MYVEDVNSVELQEDLVLGMYNMLHPSGIYQPDSVFENLNLSAKSTFGLGLRIKFQKGKILVIKYCPIAVQKRPE